MNNIAHLEPYAHLLTRSVAAVAADLESYALLLKKWQAVQNLVSRETLSEVWLRHFVDSLQVLKLLRPTDVHFLDLGSGGGFPALPLAIALKNGPQRFTLVEPTSRKISFMLIINNPNQNVKLVLLYGENRSLIEERCKSIIKNIDIDPLFNIRKIDFSNIKTNIDNLENEVNAISINGKINIIKIDNFPSSITQAVTKILSNIKSRNKVIILANNLPPSSSARRFFENHDFD
ncbi:MAG: hypothetical protein EOP04_27085, partial [Proteobacteria bacterium]